VCVWSMRAHFQLKRKSFFIQSTRQIEVRKMKIKIIFARMRGNYGDLNFCIRIRLSPCKYVNQSKFRLDLKFSKVLGFFLIDKHQTQQKKSKFELHTRFWRQAISKNWDLTISRSIASAHLGFFQGSGLFQLDNHQTQQKKFKSRAPYSVLSAGEFKNQRLSSKNDSCGHFSIHRC
jgi:hypothetical protein